ncbi:MAG: hypothetical protein ACTH31_05010, partial [Pseudoclavibacter sp.]
MGWNILFAVRRIANRIAANTRTNLSTSPIRAYCNDGSKNAGHYDAGKVAGKAIERPKCSGERRIGHTRGDIVEREIRRVDDEMKGHVMPASTLEYSEIPARAAKILENFMPDEELIAKRAAEFADVTPREPNSEGDVEVLDGVEFTHHFTDVDGDKELVRFHWVECGEGEPIVFLHGIP